MPQLGSSSHQTDLAAWMSGTVNPNMFAKRLTMTEDGTLTRAGFWAAGYTGSVSTRAMVWSSGGTAIRDYSSSFTMASHGAALGNSDKHDRALTQDYQADDGETLAVGYSRHPDGGSQHDMADSGTLYYGEENAILTEMAPQSSTSGRSIVAWLKYDTVPELYVRRSGSWQRVDDLLVRRSSSWQSVGPELYVRRSGSWDKV